MPANMRLRISRTDGRIVFFIPWGERGERTLIGTTDVDHDGSADEVQISEDEMRYLRDDRGADFSG